MTYYRIPHIMSSLICLAFVCFTNISHGSDESTFTFEFTESETTGIPEGWMMNHTYPGEISLIVEKEQKKEVGIVRIASIPDSERPIGILRTEGIEKQTSLYRLVLEARGEGLIEFGFSLSSGERWLASKLSRRLPLEGTWTIYEVTLEIPEFFSRGDAEELEVTTLIPSIYVFNGHAEIKSLTIEEQ